MRHLTSTTCNHTHAASLASPGQSGSPVGSPYDNQDGPPFQPNSDPETRAAGHIRRAISQVNDEMGFTWVAEGTIVHVKVNGEDRFNCHRCGAKELKIKCLGNAKRVVINHLNTDNCKRFSTSNPVTPNSEMVQTPETEGSYDLETENSYDSDDRFGHSHGGSPPATPYGFGQSQEGSPPATPSNWWAGIDKEPCAMDIGLSVADQADNSGHGEMEFGQSQEGFPPHSPSDCLTSIDKEAYVLDIPLSAAGRSDFFSNEMDVDSEVMWMVDHQMPEMSGPDAAEIMRVKPEGELMFCPLTYAPNVQPVEEDSEEEIFAGEISGCYQDLEEEDGPNETRGQENEEPGGQEAEATRAQGPEEQASEGVKEPKEVAAKVDKGPGVEEVKAGPGVEEVRADEAEELKEELAAKEAEGPVAKGPREERSRTLQTEGAKKPKERDCLTFLQDWLKALRLW
eukprot:CAMPEP_0184303970 /NCGR_PEP_ID=MMETSP1049-20130417/13618_1 /TAXON_ID=77928 /ORGANISM="Proteomonas sulcata, Strain CCMP704" /LENGTH=453 /DNA_ID=CAMNT_0026615685 /DNA_START=78 /DNA_END=1439 /DNA_ORIENTATION=-